jgi:DNA-binding transcriptional MocR family regulator
VLFIRSYDDLTFRDDVKPLTKPLPKRLALLQPLDAPRRLTAELVARLTADITSGKLPPGSRLPTEQEMIAATGVSRTVIREAVAALRADRLAILLLVTCDALFASTSTNVRPCARCSTSWSCEPGSRSKPPALPPSVLLRHNSKRSSTSSTQFRPPSTAVR